MVVTAAIARDTWKSVANIIKAIGLSEAIFVAHADWMEGVSSKTQEATIAATIKKYPTAFVVVVVIVMFEEITCVSLVFPSEVDDCCY
jgi:hypothetical protein